MNTIDNGCTRRHERNKSYAENFKYIKSLDKPTVDRTGDEDNDELRCSRTLDRKLLL